MSTTKRKEARIYWEKQTLALCGHHSLNALLQGPHVTTNDLQKIAETLDEEERKLLTSAEDSPIAVGLESWPARVVLMPSLDTKFHLLTNRPSSSRQNVGQRLFQRFLSTWGCPS